MFLLRYLLCFQFHTDSFNRVIYALSGIFCEINLLRITIICHKLFCHSYLQNHSDDHKSQYLLQIRGQLLNKYYKTCIVCNNYTTKIKTCADCKAVYYCSKHCQKKDWINGHKQLCNKYGSYSKYIDNKKQIILKRVVMTKKCSC